MLGVVGCHQKKPFGCCQEFREVPNYPAELKWFGGLVCFMKQLTSDFCENGSGLWYI